jgi:hypothetical protein
MATPTTLPAAFTAGQVLTAAQMNDLRGAFRVLQVVAAQYSTETSSSSSTFADTGLTLTITPTSASSKILAIVNQSGCYKDSNATAMGLRLVRGSTEISYFEKFGGTNATAAANGFGTCSTIILDSPATTSATTYKTQFKSEQNLSRVLVQTGTSNSTIVLMEISA